MNFTRILLLLTVFFASPSFAMRQVTYQKDATVPGRLVETYAVTLDGVEFAYTCVDSSVDLRALIYCGSKSGDLSIINDHMMRSCSDQKHCVLEPGADCKTVFNFLKKEYKRQQALLQKCTVLLGKMNIKRKKVRGSKK